MAKVLGWWTAAVVAAVLLAGCTLPREARDASGKPVVVTTFTVLADIAANVAGDRLTVESITKSGAEIHGYEPTPGDVRKAAGAVLVIRNGLGLDRWFDQFTDDLPAPSIDASNGVVPIPIASDAYAGKPNPHAWMSPLNVETYVDNIVKAFIRIDPDGAPVFRANAAAYKQQLRDVQHDLVTSLRTLPVNERALVTCEGAFSYLARDTGLTEAYIWPVNAEQQAVPRQVAATIDFVRAQRVPAVFCESTVSDKAMQRVAAASGARFGGILYVDSLSLADGPVPTYLDLIRHDARTIVDGLTGRNAQ
ncbi:MAG TPA: metal ABC transporter substrate-binding protein [Gordonia sp. (in: high G+C Gram-positive bacteria)]|uniref:metal ABC transporter substrate-binding protein n=1 Tax=unclassified Gordonia (in: high G+C Gram-positive bacteria) TaxID=2657482 RepID=UPI000F9AE460|nr:MULTISPECIES: metal ABC transporter substrate-binding protein [unclassified Gordonia (in: high G+C Gram-positive bacteria)]RUP37753.1 MAG: metal ABC transporter substrate-binding protein [Gordonia sp. (in: high G+C Gram-positive bacteria)]HNP55402.1 metal ABC transporter substrate-binding protein [Gordonia sp. (in: high G+C Gram-positive bacteria)]HRC51560.1 metal ABC transporter substrate-binding protein [Gordonia sp. (in: high G+C Gram-positive bacteria)]